MAEQAQRIIRRVVTEEDASGRARIVADERVAAVSVPERPGYNVSNIWVTGDTPAPIAAPDRTAGHKGVLPPPRGTVLRVIDYPPEATDPAERRRQLAATFGTLYPTPSIVSTTSIPACIAPKRSITRSCSRVRSLPCSTTARRCYVPAIS